MSAKPIRLTFEGAHGAELAARLDLPTGTVEAYALFAHCFTCSKDVTAARKIAEALTRRGIAVLRFDFTGLGGSGGDFGSTNFSSNLEDLRRAANHMRENLEAPKLLIGHSLGGAAMLAVAADIPEAKAVATIGAPAEADHVTHNFSAHLDEIEQSGAATVSLVGRDFRIEKQFIEDLRSQDVEARVSQLKKALLVLHAPLDDVVGIDNATKIFVAAKHPKSFVSLDNADHLLSNQQDAAYAADVIAAWASRYIELKDSAGEAAEDGVVEVRETGLGKFQAMVQAGPHRLLADEPVSVGGFASGPSPYDFLSAALGACTSMTLRMYAERKNLPLDRVSVEIGHAKVHAQDCSDCAEELRGRNGKIDRFERRIALEGDLDADTRKRLLEIADKCPVHRTLEAGVAVITKEVQPKRN
ncbi:OsmC family protein [Rhizobiales bacterium]|uniref:bifunctional alpha/beta hydrolase/OsmC family protein n=1 Tax=Hongsoonwoonella zoysiae TaxID=2821844 RepID=UPI00155F91A5|nr:bifunctional alpha/beta hydrolase/OsmC family protein [Hongsoonwoonella zoysiae]NRG19374.1 OsmC family protein [Hongsoonwoonella zoysiae]